MLAGARLRDQSPFAHPPGEKRLPQGVVDLVGAGVVEVFALQVHVDAAQLSPEPLGPGQSARAAGVLPQQAIEVGPKGIVLPGRLESGGELIQGRDEGLGHVSTAVGSEAVGQQAPPAGGLAL